MARQVFKSGTETSCLRANQFGLVQCSWVEVLSVLGGTVANVRAAGRRHLFALPLPGQDYRSVLLSVLSS